jgi:RNA polymerase sigma-B factor
MASQKEDNFIKNEQAQELHRLLAKYKKTQDKRARDKIVEQNFNLVKKIAHGLARRSTDPVDDLIQIGSIGLIKAIEYFNPDAGAKFTTYATHLITGEIRHYLRDKTSMIRAPRELQELSSVVIQLTWKLLKFYKMLNKTKFMKLMK